MASPGQKRGSCGHAMAIFDGHVFVHVVATKERERNPVYQTKKLQSVLFVTP